MSPRRRAARVRTRAVALVAALAAAAVTLSASPAAAVAAPRSAPETLTGTYELLAKDHLTADGHLDHHYTEVLRVPGRKAYPMRLPRGHGLRAGTQVKVSAYRTSGDTLDVRTVSRVSAASIPATTGPVSVLVILAHWTKPDAVTPAKARAQFFDDGNRWYRENSYGQTSLTGAVTPWLKIAPPPFGRCYEGAEALLWEARQKAEAAGYDPNRYLRTVLYFPRCVGGDTANVAGWAYEPGSVSWLNGYLDRRTTVHEQGHNAGLGHARSLACRGISGAPVTFSAKCTASEYGDLYDAMGRSGYAAHFSGYRKHLAGWLEGGRKRVLSSAAATTFTLPPYERVSSRPVVAVARSKKVYTRSYWMEFRRPVGMDARLPSGATGGVLIHLVDTATGGPRGVLLDGTPKDRTISTAVLKAGTAWTSPDGIKFAAGSVTTSGIRVTVTGARPNPTAPTVPQSVVATGLDEQLRVTWQPPSFDGWSPITGYDVTVDPGDGYTTQFRLPSTARSAVFPALTNGVRHTVTVVARNASYQSPRVTTWATPRYLAPALVFERPAEGAVLRGYVEAAAFADPNALSGHQIQCLHIYLDQDHVGGGCGGTSGWTVGVDTTTRPNGTHVFRAVAVDANSRTAEVRRTVKFANPLPEVAITTPANGTVFPDTETVTLESAASVPSDPSVTVGSVTYFDVTNGWYAELGRASAPPFRLVANVSHLAGPRKIVAVAHASNGMRGESPPVDVEVRHPETTLTFTEPAAGATVSGATVRLAADVTVRAAGSAPQAVAFYMNGGLIGAPDTTAPYSVDWDTSHINGDQYVSVVVVETTGRRVEVGRYVAVRNKLPNVAITAPSPNQSLPHGTVRLSGTSSAADGGEAPDRVVVAVDGVTVGTVRTAADGAWSLDWNTGTTYGYRRLAVTAYTPAGLRRTVERQFAVYRPEPVVRLDAPASDARVPAYSVIDVVISAAPAAGDYRTIREVCVVVYWTYRRHCTSAPGLDGRYHIPWTTGAPDWHYLQPVVVMSDGFSHAGIGNYVTVFGVT